MKVATIAKHPLFESYDMQGIKENRLLMAPMRRSMYQTEDMIQQGNLLNEINQLIDNNTLLI